MLRGSAKYSLKDYYGAITDFTEAACLDPNGEMIYVSDVYLLRGRAKLMLGDKRGGTEDLQQAANLYKKEGNTVEYENVREEIIDNYKTSP